MFGGLVQLSLKPVAHWSLPPPVDFETPAVGSREWRAQRVARKCWLLEIGVIKTWTELTDDELDAKFVRERDRMVRSTREMQTRGVHT